MAGTVRAMFIMSINYIFTLGMFEKSHLEQWHSVMFYY